MTLNLPKDIVHIFLFQQSNFNDLMRGGQGSKPESSKEFKDSVIKALAKVNEVARLPGEKIAKFIKRTPYKKELRDYYLDLLK